MPFRSHRRSLGNRVRLYRERVGITQEKLAEKAELTPKYLGEVERGLVNISVDSLVRIAKALNVRLRDIVADL